MNSLVNALNNQSNYKYTENGGLTHASTLNKVYDLFSFGGAYRQRSESDCILLFKNAYEENPELALKCLFYLADIRGGQGERRFFRLCYNWLAKNYPDAALRNMELIPEYRRWDDLYCLVDTKLENAMFAFIKKQLLLDLECKTPSLCGKWLHSENCSSKEHRALGNKTRCAFDMNHKQYRQMLSLLRKRINIVERLMSSNQWDKIEFDKLPSKAGLKYKNAFARRDIIKAKYEKFAKDVTTKVNADTLYPYEVVSQAIQLMGSGSWTNHNVSRNNVDRLMINKYWDNLTDYFNGKSLNALCMIDTSGSMTCGGSKEAKPIDVATSLGLYCAERCNGPFKNMYISFSSRPQLIKTEGIDFCDKVDRIVRTDLCENTNIEAAFDMLLNTAIQNHVPQKDMPKNIIVISDMEFDSCQGYHHRGETDLEMIARRWKIAGYEFPHMIYWNVNARNNNIPQLGAGRISYVSGFSPAIFEMVMSMKSGIDLMLEKLNSERYANVK